MLTTWIPSDLHVFLGKVISLASNIRWIKIATDIFDDEKILLIESLPDAHSIIVVWFKLLCFAGKQNNSGVFMMDKVAYTEQMLATIFRMKVQTVQLALQTFKQLGMIDVVEGVITIPNWSKHQSLDAYEKKKERDRQYQAERRASQKLLIMAQTSICQATASSDIAALDVDIEKKEDKDLDTCALVIDHLNIRTGSHYHTTSKASTSNLLERIQEGFTADDLIAVIDYKSAEWIGTPFQQYLRPSTLFGPKFESYLYAATHDSDHMPSQAPSSQKMSLNSFYAMATAFGEEDNLHD